jgi:hypothetical protein
VSFPCTFQNTHDTRRVLSRIHTAKESIVWQENSRLYGNFSLLCTAKKHPANTLFVRRLTGDTRQRKASLFSCRSRLLYAMWQVSSPGVSLWHSAKSVFAVFISLPSVFYMLCRVLILRRVLTLCTEFFAVYGFLAPGEELLCRVPKQRHQICVFISLCGRGEYLCMCGIWKRRRRKRKRKKR